MSEIDPIFSESNSGPSIESNSNQQISNPVNEAIQSASSIQELEDMLKILDNAASSHHPKVTQSIQALSNKIKEGASLNEIKTSAIR